jgi:branched-chain amino acid transport system substrate-binding protein
MKPFSPLTTRRLALALAGAAGLLALPAAHAQSCGQSTGKPAGGAPIPIGAIVGKTGPDDFSSSAQAAAAYFKCVNANGGIHGRPIQYLVEDDQWNPETASQVASKLVRDRKVLALAGNASFVECGANAKFYEQENVIAIAGVGVPRECYFARNYVPLNMGPRLSMTQVALYAKQQYKATRMVCIAPNIPSLGRWSCEGPTLWGKQNGVTVDTIVMDPDSADPTSVVLQAASKNPQAILLGLPKGLMVPILAAAEQQNLGKRIHFVSAASGYDLGVPKAIGPYWQGNFDVNLEFQPLDATTPDNRNWLAVMNRYGDPKNPRDTFSQAGYLAARLVADTLLKLPADQLDRAHVSAALRDVKDFRSDILCEPFYVGAGARHNANHAGRVAQSTGSGWKTVSTCQSVDDPQLADLRATEPKAH